MSAWRAMASRTGAFFVLLPLIVLTITVPLNFKEQWQFAGVTVLGAMLLSRRPGRKVTVTVGLLSLLVSTRYMFWRTTQTLSFGTPLEFLLGSTLYLAELYAWVILFLGFIQMSWPLDRPVIEIEGEPENWPTVDVYIPTYNESLAIVRNTVFAAMDMDYPAGRFRVFILDDGRRPEFRAFARAAGCGYITRDNNLHAKAGNLNAAMKKTDGELIAIFDCDHVPTRAFLQLTVGWFQKDKRLAVLQTPHYFYSPDPVQRNLATVKDMPGEGELFYGPVQEGNDLWNATFFCGSCAIIRREALMETNGFAGETVTEDAHTALKLQRTGWNTAYINARLSAGLATERLVLHIGQRIRWARGMTQILRIDNPLFGPGLSWQQRLCYLNAMLHFQFPLPRIVFLTSPMAYLLFGQNIIHASATQIFSYALPHLFCAAAASKRQHKGDRRPFWGEVYETILAFHLVKPTVMTWFQPRKGKFNVTDKGDLLDQTFFDWAIVQPHLICIGLIAGSVLLGFVKLIFFPQMFNIQLDSLALNTAWATFSLIILLAAVSVARESRQARQDLRIPAELPVNVYLASGHVVAGKTFNVSMGGAAIVLPAEVTAKDLQVTHIALAMGDEVLSLPVDTVRAQGGRAYLRFKPLDMMASRQLVRAVMGRADAWQLEAPHPVVSGTSSLADIVKVDMVTMKRILRLNFAERRQMRAQRAEAQKKAQEAQEAEAARTTSVESEQAKAPSRKALFAKVAAVALVAVGLGIMVQPDPVQAQSVAASPATTPTGAPMVRAAAGASALGARHLHLSLKDLRIKTPIRLAGTHGEIGIPFGMRQSDVVTDAVLTLHLAWSPALLGDVSQLVVLVNGEVAQTIPLRPGDSGGQELKIPVNPALFLPGDNQLNLRLIGHYARDCEDPFHSSLWANVSNTQSWLDLTVQPTAQTLDLARLPGPFFDRFDNAALSLPFVFAGKPSHGDLSAAASMASWFGSLASYRGFGFKPMVGQLPMGNAVVFLRSGSVLPGIDVPVTGPAATLVRNPLDPTGTLLVITGRNDDEIRLAAGALATGRGVAGGARMAYDGMRVPTYPRYGAPRWITTDRPVRLGEIMAPYALQGMGLPPGPLSARFRVAPDLFFWPREGGTLDLRYRYPTATWLDRKASRLDVSLNGQFLRTLPLAEGWWQWLWGGNAAQSTDSRANVVLPRYDMFGQNELVFDYNLIIADKKKCTGTLPDNVRVALDPNSTIDLTQAWHAIAMPNLATFAGAGYPFTVRPDLAETTVVMDANPGMDVIEAFLDLMGRMGDATGVPTTGVTVVSDIDADRLQEQDILVIGSSALAGTGALFGDAPVRFLNGALRVKERSPLQYVEALFGGSSWESGSDEAQSMVYAAKGFSGIVSFQSPFTHGRTVVALLADQTSTLPSLVDGLNDDKVNAQVQGDLSVATGDGMSSFSIMPTYWVGDLPFWMKIAFWFSRHPLLMAMSGLLVAMVLSGPVYLYFRMQARRRLADAGDDK
ncbi:putative cellulose synthase [Novosphingobium nitrogenifigens DSM 19370]|uniref:Cellulose synthase catalytic subunit [UDP-forming] n=1 Tax=Novosphingobium nitrogenifigens DSM 19370 TaxID=983920 RepID=F1Z4Y7_9SPHN|nr:UDP-forming cellulose synthase catalytic subunit [Novosphingobium nitrogenifigens]EGD59978.1 putative cellulose synthase [Novosphingobium nitrogenifigens DSM 19370]